MHGNGNKEAAERCFIPFRQAPLLREQRNELIRKQLKATPEMSDRQIALKLRVSDKTVAVQRRELEAASEIPHLMNILGADGKSYPRHGSSHEKPRDPSATSAFRYAEGCLYNYNANLSQLQQCEAKLRSLSSASVTNYDAEGGHSAGTHSDPVARYGELALRLDRRIIRLKHRTEPITRLLADLKAPYALLGSPNPEMARLIELYYFGKSPVSAVSEEMHISRMEVYRRREKVVLLAIKYGLRR